MNRSSFRIALLLAILVTPGISYTQGTTNVNTEKNTAMEKNKSTIYDLFEKAINGKNLALLDDLFADDYTGPTGLKGGAAFRVNIEPIVRAFPDIHYDLTSVVADDDKVAVSWRWEGTNTTPYRHYPLTHKKFGNDGIGIFTLRDGRVTNAIVETDRLGFLLNMGVVDEAVIGAPGGAARPGTPTAGPGDSSSRVYFIDKFFVPTPGIDEFTERMQKNRDFLKTLPGFIKDDAYSSKDADGNFTFVTIAVWRDHAAVENAKQLVMAEYKKEGFDLQAMLTRLHITIDRGLYSTMKNAAPTMAN
jgi:predicted ester cyclase